MAPTITKPVYDEPLGQIKFQISDIDLSYVNGLRRTILQSIPVWGVRGYPHSDRTIDFQINTTKVDNEQIAKQISLIPITLNKKQLKDWKAEDYEFHLDVQNQTLYQRTVTTKDIKIFNKKDKKYVEEKIRDQIFPPSPITNNFIIILRLNANYEEPENGERIKLTAQPVVSNALENASFQYHRAWFGNAIDEKVLKEKRSELEKKIKENPEEKDKLENCFETLDKYRCYSKNEYGEPTVFDFWVETQSQQLKPEYFVEKALEILQEMISDKTIQFKQENDKKIKLIYDIETKFTFPTIVQKHFVIKFIRPAKTLSKTNKLKYVGQHILHHLENFMIQDFVFEQPITVEEFQKSFNDELAEIKATIKTLQTQWFKYYSE